MYGYSKVYHKWPFYFSNLILQTALEKQGITIPTNTVVEDLADSFRVTGDATDTIDNLCIYYGYDLPTNIYNRTGLDYAKAINYCWHEMERYKEAQENK